MTVIIIRIIHDTIQLHYNWCLVLLFVYKLVVVCVQTSCCLCTDQLLLFVYKPVVVCVQTGQATHSLWHVEW